MPDTMIERMTDAIASIPAQEPEAILKMARAAIAAMREPAASQADAVRNMLERDNAYMDCSILDVWTTMIDAALAEEG